jgi:ribonuclease-3
MPLGATPELQQRLGYRFKQPALLAEALTHSSHSVPHNERLEFMGDALLDLVISDVLYQRFDKAREGELSRMRSTLVREQTLHQVALELNLGQELRLGEGEHRSGGARRASILADALEALFGAVYRDGGLASVSEVIVNLFRSRLDAIHPGVDTKDSKTRLQEWLQARRLALPVYEVTSVRGAAHEQVFDVECHIESRQLRAQGSGSSRRIAEQEAARAAFEALES